MISYEFFKDLEKVAPEDTQRVLDAILTLAALARESGCVTDDQMENALGDLFAQCPDLARGYHRPVAAAAPVNHRRCIWLSSRAFVDRERDLRRQKLLAAQVQQRPVPAVAPNQAAAASVSSDIAWRFPCEHTLSISGTVIKCASKDKKKFQHVGSDKHKKFLAEVEEKERA